MRYHSGGCGTLSQTQSATQSATQSFTAARILLPFRELASAAELDDVAPGYDEEITTTI
jgi:hypothetical protein